MLSLFASLGKVVLFKFGGESDMGSEVMTSLTPLKDIGDPTSIISDSYFYMVWQEVFL